MIMSIVVPVIFVISWKSLIPTIGAANVLAICVAIGLPGTGLMGYSLALARDRERGVFQRLRAAPVPTWVIMMSRIVVQVCMIVVTALITCAVAYFVDKIYISIPSLALIVIASAIGGLSFIALGQALVAYILSSEAVSAAARLIYMAIAVVGALGQIGLFGEITQKVVTYSPLGTTKTMLVAAMDPSTIFTEPVMIALLITLAYSVVFAILGIRAFKWSVN